MRKNMLFIILTIELLAATTIAQNATHPSRLLDEKAVRAAVYGSTVAALTADVEAYKRYAARRTLELYELTYEELVKSPEVKKAFQRSGIASVDDFMAARVRQAAGRFATLPRTQIEELARLEAAAPIIFVNNTEAKVRGVRVVLEDGEWKVDASEAIKNGLLRGDDVRLSREGRAKIERF